MPLLCAVLGTCKCHSPAICGFGQFLCCIAYWNAAHADLGRSAPQADLRYAYGFCQQHALPDDKAKLCISVAANVRKEEKLTSIKSSHDTSM